MSAVAAVRLIGMTQITAMHNMLLAQIRPLAWLLRGMHRGVDI